VACEERAYPFEHVVHTCASEQSAQLLMQGKQPVGEGYWLAGHLTSHVLAEVKPAGKAQEVQWVAEP
jgi:hypothetical protein